MNRWALCALALCVACEPNGRPRSAHDVDPLDPALVTRLSDAQAAVRAQAAFTLGQLGVSWDDVSVAMQASADARLADRLAQEREPSVRAAIVEALGRVGRNRGRQALLAELGQPGPARITAGWALLHLYRRLRDKIDPTPDVAALGRVLATSPEAEVRAAVTGALAETKRANARPLLLRELIDVAPLARVEASHGLIALATPDDTPTLAAALHDADERVAANAAVALGELAEHGAAPTVAVKALTTELAALTKPAVVVALEERAFVQERLAPLFEQLEGALSLSGEASLACLAALAHDRASAHVDLIDHCASLDATTRERYAARALAEANPKRVPVAALLNLQPADHDARATVLEGLSRYDDDKSAAAIVYTANDGDLMIRAAAGDAAVARKLTAAGPALLAGLTAIAAHATTLGVEEAGLLPSVLNAIAVLRPAGAVPVLRKFLDGTPGAIAIGARAALKAYGEAAIAHSTPPHNRHDQDEWSTGPTTVRLETDRGSIVLALDAEHAPRNARNFASLVRDGFYDGLTFHRIVPGFVAQGGDPRGDGNGGANELVACEPNYLPYREGTVGMALSGPDTGSSQFFITLAPAPHLEGRYTAFAQVIEGMDVARALRPGDHIKTARLAASDAK